MGGVRSGWASLKCGVVVGGAMGWPDWRAAARRSLRLRGVAMVGDNINLVGKGLF